MKKEDSKSEVKEKTLQLKPQEYKGLQTIICQQTGQSGIDRHILRNMQSSQTES